MAINPSPSPGGRLGQSAGLVDIPQASVGFFGGLRLSEAAQGRARGRGARRRSRPVWLRAPAHLPEGKGELLPAGAFEEVYS